MCQIRTRFDRNPAKLGRIRQALANNRSKLVRITTGNAQVWTIPRNTWPSSAQIRSSSLKVDSHVPRSGPTSAENVKTWRKLGRLRSNSDQIRPASARNRQRCGRRRSEFGRNRANVAKSGQNRTKRDPNRQKIVKAGPRSDHFRSKSPECHQLVAKLGRHRTNLVKVGPSIGNFR